jgi:hypothetical protein
MHLGDRQRLFDSSIPLWSKQKSPDENRQENAVTKLRQPDSAVGWDFGLRAGAG